jgi:hypothetical protein
MNTMDSMWEIAEVCMVVLYLFTVVVAIRHLWRRRQDCFGCTFRQALVRSGLLAFLVTPSLIGDFWLFALPGPAALGFALLSPGVLFASGHRLELLFMISVFYVLPWVACTVIIFYLWRFIRWWKVSHGRA